MIDLFASDVHFADHLAPIWRALPPEQRGAFIVTHRRIAARAAARGVRATTHEAPQEDRPVLVASFGDQKLIRDQVPPFHGQRRTRIARIEHGIGQSFIDSRHGSYAGGVNCEQVGLFLCPNEHSAKRWRDAYPRARVEVVGCPKLEDLPAREGRAEQPIVAVSFHWNGGSASTRELIETSGAFGEYRAAVERLATRYAVIGHGHPRAQPQLERQYRKMHIPFVEDFTDVCRSADVYVCDTNSTIYEFASTGRPVVVVNAAQYRRDVEHGLRFWEAATVGVNCDRPADLTAAVEEALRDAPERRRAREAALDAVYQYRDGSAARRAAEALLAWAGERERVAA